MKRGSKWAVALVVAIFAAWLGRRMLDPTEERIRINSAGSLFVQETMRKQSLERANRPQPVESEKLDVNVLLFRTSLNRALYLQFSEGSFMRLEISDKIENALAAQLVDAVDEKRKAGPVKVVAPPSAEALKSLDACQVTLTRVEKAVPQVRILEVTKNLYLACSPRSDCLAHKGNLNLGLTENVPTDALNVGQLRNVLIKTDVCEARKGAAAAPEFLLAHWYLSTM